MGTDPSPLHSAELSGSQGRFIEKVHLGEVNFFCAPRSGIFLALSGQLVKLPGLFRGPLDAFFLGVFFDGLEEEFVLALELALEEVSVDFFVEGLWEFETDSDVLFFYGFEGGWSGFGVLSCWFGLGFGFGDELFPLVGGGGSFDKGADVSFEFCHGRDG